MLDEGFGKGPCELGECLGEKKKTPLEVLSIPMILFLNLAKNLNIYSIA